MKGIVKTEVIPLSKIVFNKGQIKGVDENPRYIENDRYDLLKKSLEDDPEMMALRELLVYKVGDKYVVIGGNMRLKALRELNYKECYCKVIPENTSAKKLRAYLIKDNNGFGEWDIDKLIENWGSDPLVEYGIDPDILEFIDIEPDELMQEVELDEASGKEYIKILVSPNQVRNTDKIKFKVSQILSGFEGCKIV